MKTPMVEESRPRIPEIPPDWFRKSDLKRAPIASEYFQLEGIARAFREHKLGLPIEGTDRSHRMNSVLTFLAARLQEPSTWLGLASFGASVGTALAAAGLMQTGLIVGAVGAGFGGVGAFVAKEKSRGA